MKSPCLSLRFSYCRRIPVSFSNFCNFQCINVLLFLGNKLWCRALRVSPGLMPVFTRYLRPSFLFSAGLLFILSVLLLSRGRADILHSEKASRNQYPTIIPDIHVEQGDTQSNVTVDPYSLPTPVAASNWTFAVPQHAESYGLDRDQCGAAFPELFKEVKRAADYWAERKIHPEGVDISWKESGVVRVLINDRRVRASCKRTNVSTLTWT